MPEYEATIKIRIAGRDEFDARAGAYGVAERMIPDLIQNDGRATVPYVRVNDVSIVSNT